MEINEIQEVYDFIKRGGTPAAVNDELRDLSIDIVRGDKTVALLNQRHHISDIRLLCNIRLREAE